MDGWDSITNCAQIKGAQQRFSRVCNLMTLSVPRPLLLFATRRCHIMLKISGSPKRRLDRQTPIRGYWESTMRLPIECPGLTEEVLFLDAILAGRCQVGFGLVIICLYMHMHHACYANFYLVLNRIDFIRQIIPPISLNFDSICSLFED